MKGQPQQARRAREPGHPRRSAQPVALLRQGDGAGRDGRDRRVDRGPVRGRAAFSAADRWGKSVAIYGRAHALNQAGRCERGGAGVRRVRELRRRRTIRNRPTMARRYAMDCKQPQARAALPAPAPGRARAQPLSARQSSQSRPPSGRPGVRHGGEVDGDHGLPRIDKLCGDAYVFGNNGRQDVDVGAKRRSAGRSRFYVTGPVLVGFDLDRHGARAGVHFGPDTARLIDAGADSFHFRSRHRKGLRPKTTRVLQGRSV